MDILASFLKNRYIKHGKSHYLLAVTYNSVIKLPYYFGKNCMPLIFLLVKYFKFSPRCSGSIFRSLLFGAEKFQVPPSLKSPIPPLS